MYAYSNASFTLIIPNELFPMSITAISMLILSMKHQFTKRIVHASNFRVIVVKAEGMIIKQAITIRLIRNKRDETNVLAREKRLRDVGIRVAHITMLFDCKLE